MGKLLSFEDALAEALERCSQGESPEAVAASYPDLDLLPYLILAEQLRRTPTLGPSEQWLRRSLKHILKRVRR